MGLMTENTVGLHCATTNKS